jgi:hypothetical protein
MLKTTRAHSDIRRSLGTGAGVLLLILALLPGCTRRIEVHPRPDQSTNTLIPRSLQVTVGELSIQGADHMPGITLLEWPPRDLSRATIDYIRQRGTFSSVSDGPADLVMKLTARLSMASRGPYIYRLHLHAAVGTAVALVKSYEAERSATGSSVRWVTASDRDPIEAALQSALEDLLTTIESDRSLYLVKEPARTSKP